MIRDEKKKKGKKKINKKSKRRKKVSNERIKYLIFEIVLSIFLSLLVLILLFFSKFTIDKVNGYAMNPTLNKNEILISERKKTKIRRFDIIKIEINGEIEFRRIIGLPGESIKYIDDILYINEEVVDEAFIAKELNEYKMKNTSFTNNSDEIIYVSMIPEDTYYVLGDNRPNSLDSRELGLIIKNDIKGFYVAKLSKE